VSEEGAFEMLREKEAPTRLLYSRKEAAWLLCISPRSLDYLIGMKRLGTQRVGKRVMIPYSELVRFARANHFEPITKAA
jgi:hypothetical protein